MVAVAVVIAVAAAEATVMGGGVIFLLRIIICNRCLYDWTALNEARDLLAPCT